MPKIRNTFGRFQKLEPELEETADINWNSFEFLYSEIKLGLPRLNIINILKIIAFIFLFSPWIFVSYKKGGFGQLNENILDFYENTFPIGSNEITPKNEPSVNSTIKNGKDDI